VTSKYKGQRKREEAVLELGREIEVEVLLRGSRGRSSTIAGTISCGTEYSAVPHSTVARNK
jgi:hypothetical protein